MMTPIKREKDIIRKDCSDRRNAIDKDLHKSMDEGICALATSLVSFRYADIILLYAPIKSEIDVMPIFHEAIKKGKRVAFPRCNVEERTMKFHFVTSEDELSPCAYGIREPREDAPVYDPKTETGSAVCYVPGLAFDVYGYRLGYGKGYYDKFMHTFNGCTIGVVYSEFILNTLPKGRFDKHCDVMLTEKGIKAIKKEK
ncbi:MAG: 5-formyltetrahydrofolate cyclo-ligase [Clostridia bacterium]|nr:5-formyltetrahydrofolate cyclo-ligase [Clostridia bacterium]